MALSFSCSVCKEKTTLIHLATATAYCRKEGCFIKEDHQQQIDSFSSSSSYEDDSSTNSLDEVSPLSVGLLNKKKKKKMQNKGYKKNGIDYKEPSNRKCTSKISNRTGKKKRGIIECTNK